MSDAKGFIYLASPYSHENPAVMQERYEAACATSAALIRAGKIVYSPIVHSHPLVAYGLPTEWDYWERVDETMLAHASELWVLMLPGWRQSRGVRAEIRIADQRHIPVIFTGPLA